MTWDLAFFSDEMNEDGTCPTFSPQNMLPTEALWHLLLLLDNNCPYLINPISGYPPRKSAPPLASALSESVIKGTSNFVPNQSSKRRFSCDDVRTLLHAAKLYKEVNIKGTMVVSIKPKWAVDMRLGTRRYKKGRNNGSILEWWIISATLKGIIIPKQSA